MGEQPPGFTPKMAIKTEVDWCVDCFLLLGSNVACSGFPLLVGHHIRQDTQPVESYTKNVKLTSCMEMFLSPR